MHKGNLSCREADHKQLGVGKEDGRKMLSISPSKGTQKKEVICTSLLRELVVAQ